MSNPVNPIAPITPLKPLQNINTVETADLGDTGSNFSFVLKDAINNLDKVQQEAGQAAVDLVAGNTEDFHTPIIAMEKANMSMNLAVNIRNKVLEAYKEVMRMQI